MNPKEWSTMVELTRELESSLGDGVKKVEIDLKSKSGKVTYKASLIDMASIEKAIQSIGYNVNGKVAASEAYEKLELCCKIPKEI